MDRWYGPKGLRPGGPENAVYVFTGAPGMKPLSEIAPTEQEVSDGWFYHGKHLDMFWYFDENGNSYLDEKLKEAGIDYQYDDIYWLTDVENPAQADEAFTYDNVGNRLASSDSSTEWTLQRKQRADRP